MTCQDRTCFPKMLLSYARIKSDVLHLYNGCPFVEANLQEINTVLHILSLPTNHKVTPVAAHRVIPNAVTIS